jgi:hypothetical protein
VAVAAFLGGDSDVHDDDLDVFFETKNKIGENVFLLVLRPFFRIFATIILCPNRFYVYLVNKMFLKQCNFTTKY